MYLFEIFSVENQWHTEECRTTDSLARYCDPIFQGLSHIILGGRIPVPTIRDHQRLPSAWDRGGDLGPPASVKTLKLIALQRGVGVASWLLDRILISSAKHAPTDMAQVQQGATPAPPGRTPSFENPEDVLHTINLVSQILAVATVTPIVCFRLYVIRWKNASPFRVDDCMIPSLRLALGPRTVEIITDCQNHQGVASFRL